MNSSNVGAIVVGDGCLDDRSYFEILLQSQGYDVTLAEDGDEVLRSLETQRLDKPRSEPLVMLDLMLPHHGGLETLQEVRRRYNGIPVILTSTVPVPDSVVDSIRTQKAAYLEKPILPEHLESAIRDLCESKTHVPQKRNGHSTPAAKTAVLSSFMEQIDSLITQVGGSDVPVLLQGETGVGKEVLAREIHNRSARAKKPFIKVNCAALPTELVESELFGYERGAFTGAFKDRPGRFEMAKEGTILLDEIGDMDVSLQAKLLQVLQDGEFHRLGSRELVRVDVRVMAATHQDLRKAIAEGRFREDLYYRLNVISIKIPPVRERRSEILQLAEHFLQKHRTPDFPPPPITTSVRESLLAYPWPGNIRELENIMRRFLVVRDPEMLCEELGSSSAMRRVQIAGTESPEVTIIQQDPEPDSPLEKAERNKLAAEREAVVHALESTHWNRKKAAALLNIDYKAFLYKMKKLGLGIRNPAIAKPPSFEISDLRSAATSG